MSALPRDPCFCKVPLHEIRTGRCRMGPSTSSQDVLGLVVCFFCHAGGILLNKGKAVPETHWIIVLTREFADTAPEARYYLWKIGRKLKKPRTFFTSRTYAFPGLPHRSFVRLHLPKVTLTHLVLRHRCPPISSVLHPPEYHPVISYHLSRCPEFTYRKSVV